MSYNTGKITSQSVIKILLDLCRYVSSQLGPHASATQRLNAVKINFRWIVQSLNFTGVALYGVNPTDLNFFVNLLTQWNVDETFDDPRFQYLRTQIVFAILQNRSELAQQVEEMQIMPPAVLRRQPRVHSPTEMGTASNVPDDSTIHPESKK